MKVYANGNLVEKEQMLEIFEPGFLFGWGAFETLRTYGNSIPFLLEHIERLNSALDILEIEKPDIDWEKAIRDLLLENALIDAYVRITVYKKREGTGVLIYGDTFGYYTDKVYDKGLSSVVSPYKRNTDEVASRIKSLSYLQNRLSWFHVQKQKKDEALMLNHEGALVGGSRSNLFLRKGETIVTPCLSCGAFDGITRQKVSEIIKGLGLDLEERIIRVEELEYSSEVFMTSTLMQVMPLVEHEEKPIGRGSPGEITKRILSEYRKIIYS